MTDEEMELAMLDADEVIDLVHSLEAQIALLEREVLRLRQALEDSHWTT